MSVQIHINGDNAAEAVQEFATLAAAFSGSAEVAAAAETKEEKSKRNSRTKSDKPADPKPNKEPESEAASNEEVDDTDIESGSGEGEDIPTVVDLRAKASEKSKTAEGKKAIKALLNKFESKSISEVPEEKRLELMKALEALK